MLVNHNFSTILSKISNVTEHNILEIIEKIRIVEYNVYKAKGFLWLFNIQTFLTVSALCGI